MNSGNWQQIKEIFYSALERAPAEREFFLDEACGSDADLRRDVEILLASYQSEFLEKPAVGKFNPAAIVKQQAVKIGAQINQYKIIKKLGTGGMGEVFLAEDTRLDRQVAIKFFQNASAFGAQSERRLLREAQSAARLNHPNICTIYEIAESENGSFIVMEYIDGETLEAHLQRGKLPVRESIRVVLSIADALREAHAHGIVHRDIKPSNVMLNTRGQVKVLDFSLAKKAFPENGDTKPSFLSESGIIAGTIAYMSPEQARGQSIDARSDIWSLGVVFYEMLAGCQPFAGETKSDLIAAILMTAPAPIKNWAVSFSAEIERVIFRALQKNAADRFQTIEDFAAALRQLPVASLEAKDGQQDFAAQTRRLTTQIEHADSSERDLTHTTDYSVNPKNNDRSYKSVEFIAGKIKERKLSILLLLFLGGATALGWEFGWVVKTDKLSFTADSRANLRVTRLFDVKSKPGATISTPVFSPDGNSLAFSFGGEGESGIYVKQFEGGEATKITGGWLDLSPIWSPDGQRLVFTSNRGGGNKIWSVSYPNGEPVILCPTNLPSGARLAAWNKDGSKLYFTLPGSLSTLELASGQIAEIVADAKFANIGISPNEEMISYVEVEGDKEQIWIKTLRNGEARQITKGDNHHWTPVWFSDNRRLAYTSDQNGNYQIYVISLNGGEPTQITFSETDAQEPIVSTDGLKIAYKSSTGEANIYSLEIQTQKEKPQTANTGIQLEPDVSPDGKKIFFEALTTDEKIFAGQLKIKSVDSENEQLTVGEGGAGIWSPNGKMLAFVKRIGGTLRLWAVDADGRNERRLTDENIDFAGFMSLPFEMIGSYFSWSPDGSRIAFCSQKSGQHNLWTISPDGSNEQMLTHNEDPNITFFSPLWSPSGNRLAMLAVIKPSNAAKSKRRLCVSENGQIATIFETESQIRLLGWSASGAEIYFAEKSANEVIVSKISSINPTQRKEIIRLAGAYLHGIRLSPTTGQIAFTARRDGYDNINLFSENIGKIQQLTANLDATLFYSGLKWSPDGRTLFYSKQTSGLQISMISNPN
jgi:serine/threonine protein kinase/Tol biopolymer transport system component